MIKAVLFDYNGVLVDDLDLHLESYHKLFENHGKVISDTDKEGLLWKTPYEKIRDAFGDIDENEVNILLKEKEKYYLELLKTRNVIFKDTDKLLKKLSISILNPYLENYKNYKTTKHIISNLTKIQCSFL